jgi:dedicator of cytokinesis protein 3
VVEKSEKEVAPVQFACETMESVNKELRQLINQYTLDRKRNINPFSMRLQVLCSLYYYYSLEWLLVFLV